MVIRGRVKDGVVVLQGEVFLPEGTEAPVAVRAPDEADGRTMAKERRDRLVDAFQRIASLPIEGSPEAFGGEDHDDALYGFFFNSACRSGGASPTASARS